MVMRGAASPQVTAEQIASALSRRVQQLIILPTEKCNFRCTYCYEDFAIGRMNECVQSSIERFMDRRVPELAFFTIDWFGGEPLAARKIVLRLSAYASALCKKHGVKFEGGLTTNAYVLDFDLFEELLEYDQCNYQITLDGWSNGHDAVRKLAGGGRTFERIWNNLIATRHSDKDFTIVIRIHVRRDNYDSLELLVDNIANEFAGDPRYRLDFQHLRNLGGEGGKSVERPLSRHELGEVESRLRERYDTKIPASVLGSVPLSAPDEKNSSEVLHEICYAAKPNSLLVRADGRIGKCTVALSDDRNTIGRLNSDGSVTIDDDKLRLWARGLSTGDIAALECPLVQLPQQLKSTRNEDLSTAKQLVA